MNIFKGSNWSANDVTQIQQRHEPATVTLTWHLVAKAVQGTYTPSKVHPRNKVQDLCESRGDLPGPVPNSLCGLCGRKATLNLTIRTMTVRRHQK